MGKLLFIQPINQVMFIQEVIFTEDECREIISLTDTINKIDGSVKYEHVNLKVSFDEFKLEPSNKTYWIIERLKEFLEKNTKIKIKSLKKDVHILCYGINDGFSKHIDWNPESSDVRVYTIGVLLNTDFENGDLLVYETKNPSFLDKKCGNCYIFDSMIEHEVNKITNGKRYSLVVHLLNSEINKSTII